MPNREPIAPGRSLARLEQAVGDLAAVLAGGDLEAPVPACPGWRLRDLVEHLGGVHHWAAGALLRDRSDTPAPPGPPTDRAGLADWSARYAAEVLAALRATPPEQPCWGFGPRPRTAAFWHRRQLHETAMHAWDAAASQGASSALEAWLAADGVDEVVTVFVPRQVRLGRIPPLPASLGLRCAGSRDRWLLAGDGTGGPVDGPPDAELSGPAADLLLLLWGRSDLADALDSGRVGLAGDEQAARAVLTAGLTP